MSEHIELSPALETEHDALPPHTLEEVEAEIERLEQEIETLTDELNELYAQFGQCSMVDKLDYVVHRALVEAMEVLGAAHPDHAQTDHLGTVEREINEMQKHRLLPLREQLERWTNMRDRLTTHDQSSPPYDIAA